MPGYEDIFRVLGVSDSLLSHIVSLFSVSRVDNTFVMAGVKLGDNVKCHDKVAVFRGIRIFAGSRFSLDNRHVATNGARRGWGHGRAYARYVPTAASGFVSASSSCKRRLLLLAYSTSTTALDGSAGSVANGRSSSSAGCRTSWGITDDVHVLRRPECRSMAGTDACPTSARRRNAGTDACPTSTQCRHECRHGTLSSVRHVRPVKLPVSTESKATRGG